MRPAKSKTISVRVPAALYQRIQAVHKARLAAGNDEETLAIILRTALKIGVLEMEIRQ